MSERMRGWVTSITRSTGRMVYRGARLFARLVELSFIGVVLGVAFVVCFFLED